MDLLASAFALEKTAEQLRREAEEERQRQEEAEEKRKRREERAANKVDKTFGPGSTFLRNNLLSLVDPGTTTSAATTTVATTNADQSGSASATKATTTSSSTQAGAEAKTSGATTFRPPKVRIRITSPRVSPVPPSRPKGDEIDVRRRASGDDVPSPEERPDSIEWQMLRISLEARIQQQASEIASLQADLSKAYDKISELQAAQQVELNPFQEVTEFQQKLDVLRTELTRNKSSLQQRQQDKEIQLRQEFEQEVAAMRAAHREDLEDLRQTLDQQWKDAQVRHEALLREKDHQLEELKGQTKQLRGEVARLTVTPQSSKSPSTNILSHAGTQRSWEEQMINSAKRDSSRRYGALGLDDDMQEHETDAMRVYLKNLVVNLLCETNNDVKATLIPSIAELLHLSATEVQFIYRCHPEWQPGPRPSSSLGNMLGALFGS